MKSGKHMYRNLALISQLGIQVMVPVFYIHLILTSILRVVDLLVGRCWICCGNTASCSYCMNRGGRFRRARLLL